MRKGLGRHNRRSAGGPQPSLVLDFAGTGTLDPRITFTRSTTGTYYNSSGVLSTAAINEARFDYNPSTLSPLGLLIEQSSTNLLTYSQDFSNTSWAKSGAVVALNVATAPDGTTTASTLTDTISTAAHVIYKVGVAAANTVATISVFAKQNTANKIIVGNSTDDLYTWADLSTGLIERQDTGTTGTITNIGNGYYRITCTFTPTAIKSVGIGLYKTAGTLIYLGTLTSIYIWGSQLEALAFPTSYIPTTSAQVTRASDNPIMTGTNFSSWFNQAQGTFYGEMDLNSFSIIQALAGVNLNNVYGSGKGLLLDVRSASLVSFGGNSSSADVNSGTPLTTNTVIKLAGSYNVSTAFQGVNYNNSSYVSNNTNDYAGQGNQLRLGGITSSLYLIGSGHIRKFVYYPIQVTASQSQALTGN